MHKGKRVDRVNFAYVTRKNLKNRHNSSRKRKRGDIKAEWEVNMKQKGNAKRDRDKINGRRYYERSTSGACLRLSVLHVFCCHSDRLVYFRGK